MRSPLGIHSRDAVRDTAHVQPLVSVVVPVFNGLPHLGELIESLRAQDYPNLEIVISDGGSSDGSSAFLAQLADPRLRVLTLPRGTSAAQNWTAATQAARGEFIKLICQDDVLYSTAISSQVRDLLRHPDAIMAIGLRDVIDARGSVLGRSRGLAGIDEAAGSLVPGSELIRASYLQGTNVLGEPLTVLFRSADLLSAMPWNDSAPLLLDLVTYQSVASGGSAVISHESLGAFRVSAYSWSTRIASQQFAQFRQWQHAYARDHRMEISRLDRMRALVGCHLQTMLRRGAYTVLGVRGRLRT